MTTTPLTDQQLAEIPARFEATTHPGWRDSTDVGRLLAELDRLNAELDRVRAELTTARKHLDALAVVKVWRNEDGREFLFADDVRAAIGLPTNPAAVVPSA